MSPFEVETIDLEKLQIGAAFEIDDCVIQGLSMRSWQDHVLRRLMLQLRGCVWAEPPKSIQCRYPATWWDAFKERWFPEWAIEAYPVNYVIETLEGQIFYPKLPYKVPDHVHNLRMHVRKEMAIP